jgi:hypothetical protein
MLTANALLEIREASLAAGADDFLSKPFEEEGIYGVIEQQLGIRFTSPAGDKGGPEEALPDAEALAALQAETRKNLIEAAISLSPEAIENALHEVATENSRFAEHLSALCRNRHYQTLWKALGILDNEK